MTTQTSDREVGYQGVSLRELTDGRVRRFATHYDTRARARLTA